VGFLLHQLPDHEVEFSRKVSTYDNSSSSNISHTPGQLMDEMPDKVMKIQPKEGGQFSLQVDFVKDGVGGQTNPGGAVGVGGVASPQGPLEVTAQLGEWEVIKCLMQSSIPALVGWDAQVRIAVQASIERAIQNSGPMMGGSNNPNSPY